MLKLILSMIRLPEDAKFLTGFKDAIEKGAEEKGKKRGDSFIYSATYKDMKLNIKEYVRNKYPALKMDSNKFENLYIKYLKISERLKHCGCLSSREPDVYSYNYEEATEYIIKRKQQQAQNIYWFLIWPFLTVITVSFFCLSNIDKIYSNVEKIKGHTKHHSFSKDKKMVTPLQIMIDTQSVKPHKYKITAPDGTVFFMVGYKTPTKSEIDVAYQIKHPLLTTEEAFGSDTEHGPWEDYR